MSRARQLSLRGIVAGGMCVFAFSSYAQTLESLELISRARIYDGQVVVFEGEAIGEIMLRGEYTWVNIHDGANAFGVWMPQELADTITYLGSYEATGDSVRVEGEFNRACSSHGGDMDIHARRIEIIRQGAQIYRPLEPDKLKLAYRTGASFLATALFGLVFNWLKLRSQQPHRKESA